MTNICQSCSMPMENEAVYGTNKDGSLNKDYCIYCYKNGEFIDNVSMEEYIEMNIPFAAQAGMTEQEMRHHCETIFPTLKRWKKILLLCTAVFCSEILFSANAYSCIDSDCRPCPLGFAVTQKCCSSTNENDCVVLNKKIENCGKGQWKEYPLSLPIATKDYCCKDETENNCRGGGGMKRYCGTGNVAEYPYSPVKKCCKDALGNDCVIIRAQKRCGKYQLENYPVGKSDCCNSLLKKCTGHITDCPKCL